jgi:hypothetical protein
VQRRKPGTHVALQAWSFDDGLSRSVKRFARDGRRDRSVAEDPGICPIRRHRKRNKYGENCQDAARYSYAGCRIADDAGGGMGGAIAKPGNSHYYLDNMNIASN